MPKDKEPTPTPEPQAAAPAPEPASTPQPVPAATPPPIPQADDSTVTAGQVAQLKDQVLELQGQLAAKDEAIKAQDAEIERLAAIEREHDTAMSSDEAPPTVGHASVKAWLNAQAASLRERFNTNVESPTARRALIAVDQLELAAGAVDVAEELLD